MGMQVTRKEAPNRAALIIGLLWVGSSLGHAQVPVEDHSYSLHQWTDDQLRLFKPFVAPGENPCPEGEYRDLGASQTEVVCFPRNRATGFSPSEFAAALPDRRFEVTVCSEAAVQDALAAARAQGGGTIRLPACTITITRTLELPDSVALEGAGTGQTVIHEPTRLIDGMSAKGVQHVAVRDLTIDGGSTPFSILYTRNVLVERIETRRSGRNGLHFGYSRQITVRYSSFHDHEVQNGLSTKDCYPTFIESTRCGSIEDEAERQLCIDELVITEALCEETIRDVAQYAHGRTVEPGAVWTSGYAIYSNHFYNNVSDYGVALHATDGEVAGNWIMRNRRGAKFPDARNVAIHHNLVQENTYFGIHVYAIIQDHVPTDLDIYANRIVGNGEFAMRLEGAKGITLINNRYWANNQCYESCWDPPGYGVNSLRIDTRQIGDQLITPEVFVCPGDQDALIDVRGYPVGFAPGDVCALVVSSPGEEPFSGSLGHPYPNPARDLSRLEIRSDRPQQVQLALYDAIGRRVRSIFDGSVAGGELRRLEVAVGDLPAGAYLLRLTTEGAVASRALIVLR